MTVNNEISHDFSPQRAFVFLEILYIRHDCFFDYTNIISRLQHTIILILLLLCGLALVRVSIIDRKELCRRQKQCDVFLQSAVYGLNHS